jgi:large subunit ribosomal protein L15
MPVRSRKVRKLRGSRLHGWGISGQHRGGGMRGGRGDSGKFKHKWTYVTKYSLENIGKKGFHCPTRQSHSIINVSQLDDLVQRLTISGKSLQKVKNKYIIDLTNLGFDKLLGSGRIETPLSVRVASYSEVAKKKIEGVGGTIVTSSEATEQ